MLLQKLRVFFRTEQSHQWNPEVFHIKLRTQKFFPYLLRWKDWNKDGLCSYKCEQDCFAAFHSTLLTEKNPNCTTMIITKFTITELSYNLKKWLSFHWHSGFESYLLNSFWHQHCMTELLYINGSSLTPTSEQQGSKLTLPEVLFELLPHEC